ncbi:MAG TPA: PKD domain-containing protein [Flavobacteriales bacterium]|nr:PKD domain-containing protein [Flavobacteriales bacterium]
MNKHLLSIGFLSLIGLSLTHAQNSAKIAALNQSVVAIQGSATASCGTFRTMESLKYTDGGDARVVQVKIEQPVCDKQQGILAMINPSGADWKYKVIKKDGDVVCEGLVGYNRRVGSLETGNYLIQFTLPDGTSAVDEFTVRAPKGMNTKLELAQTNQYTSGNELLFSASGDSGLEYSWDFGDGSKPVYGVNEISHRFLKPGAYTITLVSSNFDCTSNISQQITITGPVVSEVSDN